MEPALTLHILFEAPKLLIGVGGILGIIEPIEQKLDKIAAKDFESGIRHMKEILAAKHQSDFLLKTAWTRFAAAIAVETGVRRARAYVALAFCQYRLDERTIAIGTLQEFCDWNYIDKPTRIKKLALNAATFLLPGGAALWTAIQIAQPGDWTAAYAKWLSHYPAEKQVTLLQQEAKTTITKLVAAH
jgi:hypothetical protein